jgi:hypothetical protein
MMDQVHEPAIVGLHVALARRHALATHSAPQSAPSPPGELANLLTHIAIIRLNARPISRDGAHSSGR